MPPQAPTKGQAVQFTGTIVQFRALAADTNGAFSLFETRVAPQQGTMPHFQRNDEEGFLVLEGTFIFQIGDEQQQLGPGGFTYVRKGVTHAFFNPGPEVGRMLIITTPGGYHDQFFAEIGDPAPGLEGPIPLDPPDVGRIIAASQRIGMEIIPPKS